MGMRRKPAKLDAGGLWEYALRALAKRAHSTAELKQKLALRAESPEVLTATMAKLREYELSDDRKFSEAFAASRLQNQGLGKLRVLRDLRSKRVSDRIASEAVTKAYAETDEAALIDAFLERKYRGKDLPVFLREEKNLASAYRRLRTAGFSSAGSIASLKRHSTAVQDWPEDDTEGS